MADKVDEIVSRRERVQAIYPLTPALSLGISDRRPAPLGKFYFLGVSAEAIIAASDSTVNQKTTLMDHNNNHHNQLCAEEVSLTQIAAQHGTPCYVYSRAPIERRWRAFDAALAAVDHLVC